MYNRYKNENLYIAGPVCFYERGYTLWDLRRRQAEYAGFGVSLPNDSKLDLTNTDPRKNADTIFRNCADSINKSTGIMADLELFRGSEPDGGTVYEIGMAYARGLRCYGFGRDLRPMHTRHQLAVVKDDIAEDGYGWELPYGNLPYCPSLVGSCKLVEGDFGTALGQLITDLNEESKAAAFGAVSKPASAAPIETETPKRQKPVVYLASPVRYAPDAAPRYAAMKAACEDAGYSVLTPLDGGLWPQSDDPYTAAAVLFDRWQRMVRDCDILVADLNDFHGWEPSSDVAFECGMAWQLGKKCVGYMSDTRNMQNRIPHYSAQKGGADVSDFVVEDFDYPINLMFASSMPVLQGTLEQIITQID